MIDLHQNPGSKDSRVFSDSLNKDYSGSTLSSLAKEDCVSSGDQDDLLQVAESLSYYYAQLAEEPYFEEVVRKEELGI